MPPSSLTSLFNQFVATTALRANTSKLIKAAKAEFTCPPAKIPSSTAPTPAAKISDFTGSRYGYRFGLQKPFQMPNSVMQHFGFDPLTNKDECPILKAPDIAEFAFLSGLSATNKGSIYTGMIDLSCYGKGESHFYLVAAHCGSIPQMAASCGLPAAAVKASIGSPLGMIATWCGCMMAGGASVHAAPGMIQALSELGSENRTLPKVIGRGDLTDGDDMVELSNAERSADNGATLNAFLARTMYFHSLSGSVLHMQYIDKSGEIFWFWVGAGGKGFNSKWVNNFVAIDLDLGMWPDMARSMQHFYRDGATIKDFVQSDPKNLSEGIKRILRSTKANTGTLKEVLQTFQVFGGFPARLTGAGVSDFRPRSVKGQ